MQTSWVLIIAGIGLISFTGCRSAKSANETMWSAQSASSDNAWLALARKDHTNHGFGGESVWTIVEMKQNFPKSEPVEVLEFDDDDGSDPIHDLKMNWSSPQHLDVTYRGDTAVSFQAIKAFGKTVTAEKLP